MSFTLPKRTDMRNALRDWKGHSWELEKWLRDKNLLKSGDKYRFMSGISLWFNYREPEAATFADPSLFRFMNEKRFQREAARRNDNNDWQQHFNILQKRIDRAAPKNDTPDYSQFFNILQKRIDRAAPKNDTPDYSQFFNIMRAAGELSNFHNMVIEADEMKDEIAKLFKEALKKDGMKRKILVEVESTLPGGTDVTEVRRVNIENMDEIIHLLENMGIETEEDMGYELGKITKYADINKVTILDVDQLPISMRPGKRRTPGFFSWLVKPSPFDLTRYQMYENIEDVDTELCFIHALRMKGVDGDIINGISNDLKDIKNVTLKTIEHMAEKYNLHINVRSVYNYQGKLKWYPNRFPRRDMYEQRDDWIELCFYTIAGEDFPEHIIPYDEGIKFNLNYFKVTDEQKQYLNTLSISKVLHFSKYNRNGPRFDLKNERTFNSMELLLNIHDPKLQDKILTPLTMEQKKYLLHKDCDADKDIFEIGPSCYRLWKTKSRNPNIIEQIYSKIDNLYQVTGNVEAIIRKCISSLGPRISKRQHITVPITDLDITSHYANAACKVDIPLGIPKRWNKNVKLEDVDAAFLMIDITRFKKWRKFTAVNYMKKGIAWVDHITLRDLIKWHDIEYTILDGIYYNEGTVCIAKEIRDIFEIRKKAIIDGNKELSDDIKNLLNKRMYGDSIKHARNYDKMYFDTFDEALTFMCRNNATLLKSTKNNRYAVTIGKRWTDSYNLAFFGCLILSTARTIINNYIFTLEDNGVEVLYSNLDSLFIRTSDMEKFNELFPDAQGSDIGKLHYDFDYDGFTEAQEAIFLKKGLYILKLDDEHYQFRNIGKYFEDPTWDDYASELRELDSEA